ncbi:hypothetical protein A0O34_20620 [Chryseobacterium glaciei]|uniref:Uncharacterized protein n=1 Tax=Chryseobacterium glaciei TaxID=1685010 RepID=A0A172Y0V2_9FLAO|nr:anti-phage protein KwaA [Chryseobacterium glaciei]ANF52770.1 hypothetical protein A0O34_20620 [Chryseobacterium glaciei]
MKLKIQLYVLSLWLLFILLFINKVSFPTCFGINCGFISFQDILEMNIIPSISLIIVILGFIFYFQFKYIINGNRSLPEKISKIENLNWEHLTFLVTYILPFLSFNLGENRNGLIFFLSLIIIGFIYVKTNMFYTNPTLALLGYHIYKISTANNDGIIIITKDIIKKDDWIKSKLLSDNIYIANKT